jgi:hypothetical protein
VDGNDELGAVNRDHDPHSFPANAPDVPRASIGVLIRTLGIVPNNFEIVLGQAKPPHLVPSASR